MVTTRRRCLVVLLVTGAMLASACGGSAQPSPTAAAAAPSAPSPSPAAAPSPVQVAPASPSPSPSPSPVAGGESYTVEAGDTLATIAERFYGDPSLWRRIYDANRTAIGDNPDSLRVGTTLQIPPRP
jgi:nucleoid-associated protein YgaU